MEAAAVPVLAEPDDETFDIYDADCNLIGQEKRKKVHAEGILHKAVYCFVFDKQGRLLVQRRSLKKKVGPGQWDLSVAEHLSPGENFRDAVIRGLKEELGIQGNVSERPLAPMHMRKLVVPGKIKDFEFVESYRMDGFAGDIRFNEEEVIEVKYMTVEDVRADMQGNPEAYTQWFREELASLNYFQAA